RFQRMVAALGGPADLLERPQNYLPVAPIIRAVAALRAGIITAIDVRAIGLATVTLGGGRSRIGHSIDPAVGLTRLRRIGERLSAGEPLALVHARREREADAAAAALAAAYRIDDEGPEGIRDPIVELMRDFA
ncbi:MAG TPA: thymidine phosphorylase, partial [Beijerinckiaceae bacterium]|nr:thymidine phosphorylase [Beijerinckiaceae bacterium]